jgi:hypothetical protein
MFCDRNEKDDDWECQRQSLAADDGAAVSKRNQNGDQTKEGRHVGLDFYDLLIEIRAAIEETKSSEPLV